MNAFRTDSPSDLDPGFTFDFRPLVDPEDLEDGQRLTTYWDVEPLMRGPQPVPDWLVTDRAAIDTELGVLKTGKEADVFALERAVADGFEPQGAARSCVLAAKRYRLAAITTPPSGSCGSARSTRWTSASLPVLRTPSSVSMAPLDVTTQSGRGSGPRMRASRSSQRDQR
jgi:hypothetical protein